MSIAHTLSGVVATSAAASGISFFGFKRNAGRIQFSKQHVSRISRRFHLLPCALGSERPAVETIPREEEGLGTGEPGGGTNEGDLSSGSNPATLGAASTGAAASKAATSYIAASPFSPQVAAAAASLEGEFAEVDRLVAVNLKRVLDAFASARVGRHHFSGTTGYGHGDAGGREALDSAFAQIVGAEAACVRAQVERGAAVRVIR
ncbi:unnamed protein product, partial [Closterium sp. NIES-53]